MNTAKLLRNYHHLTAEERFRLILSAGARGDQTEQDRVIKAGGTVTIELHDHAPFAHAFADLAHFIYLELLESASEYLDFLHRSHPGFGAEQAPEDGNPSEYPEELETNEADSRRMSEQAEDGYFDLALAAGFVLRTKAAGWELFCERLNVPPVTLWQELPGFNRLQGALAAAEQLAFAPEGFLRWLNSNAQAGTPLITVPMTAEKVAAATEAAFREQVAWWAS